MSEHITLTRDELTREIAQLRFGAAPGKESDACHAKGWSRYQSNFDWEPSRLYLTDANAALELLEEMPRASISYFPKGQCIVKIETKKFIAAVGTFHEAICLAWYHWKTGNLAELKEADNE